MFKYPMRVRDYECDVQRVVNNSVYQNYLEHARHEFLLSKGVDFSALAEMEVNLMVTRVEMDFKRPLKPKDDFYVTVEVEKVSRIQYAFVQKIHHENDELMVSARTIGVAVNAKGRPMASPELDDLLV
ncbi:acyl-CoA thioesterase [Thiomicrorhabdus sp. ZW0627]|uniref:acyl-CoA thioesterase n=1 Tax=Thiomicrorhabdus sp. ZW0627 TaxID=3039774 RepID=UPI0024367CA7|nr:acyl-CoA thioesterase [Thiomicrorhabdus sp. ZW0627]MDG6773885.1 acyl-CoA thioesterase [Thiomicrorhabdus sp. ZW0627]